MHTEDRHVFFCVGGEVTVIKLHGHVDVGFVVCGFAAGKQGNIVIVPCNVWVESHAVYVGTYPRVPKLQKTIPRNVELPATLCRSVAQA